MLKKTLLKHIDRHASRWLVFAIDLSIVVHAFVLAYLIRFNFSFHFDWQHLQYQLPTVVLVSGVCFLIIGSHKGIVRHSGQKDAINIFKAVTLSVGILIAMVLLNSTFKVAPNHTIPLSIIIVYYLLSTMLLIASRYVFKVAYRTVIQGLRPKKNTLIYGAGSSGLITHTAITKESNSPYNIIGFIDDNPSKTGKTIDGVLVYAKEALTDAFIFKKKINVVIVSIQNINPSLLMELTDELLKHDIQVKIVPSVKQWIDGSLDTQQIAAIEIEDLLDRAAIQLDNPVVKEELSNKTVFVTGAAGSIGSEIARQITNCNVKQLILIDQAESALYDLQQEFKQKSKQNFTAIVSDVRDAVRMEYLFKTYQPDFVFHAAAYKHVPLMEETPYESVRINVCGTMLLADLSVKYTAEKFVMISTDKAVNPTNVMGATKRVAEMYIACLEGISQTKFITTRFGNVLGSNGSVVPLFKKQIQEGGPLTVTHKDITRYFMTIPEACQLVLEAGIMGNGGEIYVFDMGESVKIYDVALKMIQLSGLKFPKDIDIKITGLRPGEKLYEELLASNENTLPTHHDKIMIAKTPEIEKDVVKSAIEKICMLNQTQQNIAVIKLLKTLVPEYVSNNSKYEALDDKDE